MLSCCSGFKNCFVPLYLGYGSCISMPRSSSLPFKLNFFNLLTLLPRIQKNLSPVQNIFRTFLCPLIPSVTNNQISYAFSFISTPLPRKHHSYSFKIHQHLIQLTMVSLQIICRSLFACLLDLFSTQLTKR